MARLTLDRMAAGGMYDLLGGGFHRYSVDAHWLVPHFEKMLYDNALLASAYLHAWVVTGEERYRRVTTETLDYVLRELRLPEGGLASAQDADTDGVEGLTFTWTAEEIEAVLGEPHPEWLLPFEHGRFVLRAEIPEEAREQLLAERETPPAAAARRQGPGRLERARAVRARPGRRAARPRGLRRRRGRASPSSCSDRSPTTAAGCCARSGRATRRSPPTSRTTRTSPTACVELSWATGDLRWLEEAHRLAGLIVELFADPIPRRLLRGRARGRRPRRAAQGVRRPPDPGRELDGRVRASPPRTDLRRARARDAGGRCLPPRPPADGARARPPSHTSSAPSTSTSRRPRRSRSSGRLGGAARAPRSRATGRTPSSRSRPSRPRPCRSSPARTLVDGSPAAYVCESFACQRPVTDGRRAAALLAPPRSGR